MLASDCYSCETYVLATVRSRQNNRPVQISMGLLGNKRTRRLRRLRRLVELHDPVMGFVVSNSKDAIQKNNMNW
eukprot:gene8085-biopygen608